MNTIVAPSTVSSPLGRSECEPLSHGNRNYYILLLIILLLTCGPSWSACGSIAETVAPADELRRTSFGRFSERVDNSLAAGLSIALATSFNQPLRSRWRTARCSPPQTETQARIISSLQQYRPEFFVAVAAVLLQAFLIVLLLIERRRRRTAELNARLRLAELHQVNRVAALGEMSAAIAHELGQPLAAILTNAEAVTLLLAQKPPQIEEAHQALQAIVRDNQRASDVMRRITALYQKNACTPAPINVNALIAEVTHMNAREAAHRNVEVTLDLGAGIPTISGDRIQLQQVVLNLLRNAMDAIPDDSTVRRVIISTRRNDDGVRISVSDSGVGIPEDARAHIFEPFFTTKNQGVGLGLAISKRIVEAHNGRINVFRSPMGGAQLALELPAVGVL